MRYALNSVVLSFYLLYVNCVYSQTNNASGNDNNVLPAGALKPYGRYFINTEQNLELIS